MFYNDRTKRIKKHDYYATKVVNVNELSKCYFTTHLHLHLLY